MTALDLVARGVEFIHGGGRVRVTMPTGASREIAEAVRFEVAVRIEMVRELKPKPAPGQCETCGDALACGRGGMCSLCTVARMKVLDE